MPRKGQKKTNKLTINLTVSLISLVLLCFSFGHFLHNLRTLVLICRVKRTWKNLDEIPALVTYRIDLFLIANNNHNCQMLVYIFRYVSIIFLNICYHYSTGIWIAIISLRKLTLSSWRPRFICIEINRLRFTYLCLFNIAAWDSLIFLNIYIYFWDENDL